MEISDGEQTAGANFGSLELVSPEEIEAGELACIKLRFVAGSVGLGRGGTLTIWTDSDSDWAKPQVEDPTADGYLNLVPPIGCAASIHTPDHKSFVITLMSGKLSEGDSIDIDLKPCVSLDHFYGVPHLVEGLQSEEVHLQ